MRLHVQIMLLNACKKVREICHLKFSVQILQQHSCHLHTLASTPQQFPFLVTMFILIRYFCLMILFRFFRYPPCGRLLLTFLLLYFLHLQRTEIVEQKYFCAICKREVFARTGPRGRFRRPNGLEGWHCFTCYKRLQYAIAKNTQQGGERYFCTACEREVFARAGPHCRRRSIRGLVGWICDACYCKERRAKKRNCRK